MRVIGTVTLLVVAVAMAGFFSVHPTSAETEQSAMGQIQAAFSATLNAENSGGSVGSLDENLTHALALLAEGSTVQASQPGTAQDLYAQATSIAAGVATSAAAEAATGQSLSAARTLSFMVEIAVLAAAGVIAYLYLPRVFWTIWTWLHRDSKVKLP